MKYYSFQPRRKSEKGSKCPIFSRQHFPPAIAITITSLLRKLLGIFLISTVQVLINFLIFAKSIYINENMKKKIHFTILFLQYRLQIVDVTLIWFGRYTRIGCKISPKKVCHYDFITILIHKFSSNKRIILMIKCSKFANLFEND